MRACRYITNSLQVLRKDNCYCSLRNRLFQYNLYTTPVARKVLPVEGVNDSTWSVAQLSKHAEKKKNNTNIDTDDVARHESVSDWWNEDGYMKPLHRMNDIRISFIRNGLENTGILKAQNITSNPHYLKNIKIIDVGCGAGILCEPLARLGADVTGLDPSSKLMDIAKQHAIENAHTLNSQPNYVSSNIEDYAPTNIEKFDVLVISEVIEHVIDKERFLETCLKVLKPGGSVFFTTPNRTNLSWFCNIVMGEDVLKLLPKGIHDWSNFILPDELQNLLNKLGCETVSINGIHFNVLTCQWSWGSTILHYTLHAVKTDTLSVKV